MSSCLSNVSSPSSVCLPDLDTFDLECNEDKENLNPSDSKLSMLSESTLKRTHASVYVQSETRMQRAVRLTGFPISASIGEGAKWLLKEQKRLDWFVRSRREPR